MVAHTHRVVGGTSAFVITSAVGMSWEEVGIATVFAAMGSTFPDDVEKPLHLKHRKTSHRPAVQIAFFALLVVAVAMLAPEWTGLAAVMAVPMLFACLMHSVADGMTVHKDGIQYLWPIRLRGYHLLPWHLRVKVGSSSVSEWVFVVVWTGFVLIYTYAHFGPLIYS